MHSAHRLARKVEILSVRGLERLLLLLVLQSCHVICSNSTQNRSGKGTRHSPVQRVSLSLEGVQAHVVIVVELVQNSGFAKQ